MRRALFIPSTVGMGHVVRCRAIANELANRGWACSTSGGKRPSGFDGDVVVLDGILAEADYDWGMPMVEIRDSAVIWHRRARLRICPTAHASAVIRHGTNTTLVGPQYSPLRPAFLEARDQRIHHDRDRTFVWDIRHVTGSLTEAEMATPLSVAAVAVSYAGMRAMEAACVGVPLVVLARNEGETLNAKGLARAGAAVYLGGEEEEEQVRSVVGKLLRNPERRLAMSRAGRDLVDGRGCERVADAIEEEVA